MRRTQWTMTMAATVAILLGVSACAGQPTPGPAEELPLQSGSADVRHTPSEWASPTSKPSPVAPGPDLSVGLSPNPKMNVGQVVRRVTKTAMSATVVIDRQTDTWLVAENGDRQFYAGSLVKVLVGVDALLRHPGDLKVRDQVMRMVRLSDDPICSAFWISEGGGTAIISRMRVLMGLNATEPPKTSAGQWGDTLTSANDMARIYDYVLDTAPKEVRMTIVEAMAKAPAAGADGFKQHFGIPTGIQQPWAIKQAWTNNSKQKSAHSTGMVGDNWRYTVILLTEHPPSQMWDVATRSVTAAAVAVDPLFH